MLFDTLIEKLEAWQSRDINFGHFTRGDIWKNIGLMGLLLFIAFYLFGHFPNALFFEMGVSPTAGVQIAMLMLLPLLSFVFTPFHVHGEPSSWIPLLMSFGFVCGSQTLFLH